MDGKLNRRKFTLAGLASLLVPGKAKAERNRESPASAIRSLRTSPEDIKRAIESTATSLSNGMTSFQGQKTNPRESGYAYHQNLVAHYAKKFPKVRPQELLIKLKEHLLNRIKIFPFSDSDMQKLQDDERTSNFTASRIQAFASSVQPNETVAVIYISADRQFQRLYVGKKISPDTLTFLESYPISTSAKEPKDPKIASDSGITPLGEYVIPTKGVRLALLGEVTKVERPDLTQRYFEGIPIDAVTRHFVADFDKASGDEFLTVTGDTHLIWSKEIDGMGIKIHDTTQIQDIGKSASSGCIRTPSVRRFSLMVSQNKHPTKVLIHWAKEGANEKSATGFGGHFGGGLIQKRENVNQPKKSRRP